MALNFPGLFPPRQDLNINYDFVDVIGATGHVVFDGVNLKNSTGDDYRLVENGSYISGLHTSLTPGSIQFRTEGTGGGSPGTPAKILDMDFDTSILQLPRTIEGTSYVKVSVANDTADQQSGTYIIAKLRKWDGASETEIASKQSDSLLLSANDEGVFAVGITVPRTHFKQGETIRMTIELWSESSQIIGVNHHPGNLGISASAGPVCASSAGNTRLTVSIPFKLDFI